MISDKFVEIEYVMKIKDVGKIVMEEKIKSEKREKALNERIDRLDFELNQKINEAIALKPLSPLKKQKKEQQDLSPKKQTI